MAVSPVKTQFASHYNKKHYKFQQSCNKHSGGKAALVNLSYTFRQLRGSAKRRAALKRSTLNAKASDHGPPPNTAARRPSSVILIDIQTSAGRHRNVSSVEIITAPATWLAFCWNRSAKT